MRQPFKNPGYFYIPPKTQPTNQGELIKALQPTARVELPQFLAALEDLEDGFLIPGTWKKAFHFRPKRSEHRLIFMIHT